jgi:spore germination cell wall hydrolase CwlJ-like protein
MEDKLSTESRVTEADYSNEYKVLAPDARSLLRKVMLNSKNEKLAISVAESVLDRAGETKKVETKAVQPIYITNSQVQLLAQVAKETMDD